MARFSSLRRCMSSVTWTTPAIRSASLVDAADAFLSTSPFGGASFLGGELFLALFLARLLAFHVALSESFTDPSALLSDTTDCPLLDCVRPWSSPMELPVVGSWAILSFRLRSVSGRPKVSSVIAPSSEVPGLASLSVSVLCQLSPAASALLINDSNFIM